MDHDHQLERHTIPDVKPVELLMEQLCESTLKLPVLLLTRAAALSTCMLEVGVSVQLDTLVVECRIRN